MNNFQIASESSFTTYKEVCESCGGSGSGSYRKYWTPLLMECSDVNAITEHNVMPPIEAENVFEYCSTCNGLGFVNKIRLK